MSDLYFKRMFPNLALEVEDLYLLEAFQIAYWPGWVPERALAAVLHARSSLHLFLVKKQPAIAPFLERVLAEHGPASSPQELAVCADDLVWTIADLLVYNKCPEVYDRLPFHAWDFAEITSLTPLAGKVVLDVGSGTGRVALQAAQTARWVFAVEPVGRLRTFIRERAATLGLENLYAVDGFLHAIPFPDGFADLLITSHALGWNLAVELAEAERAVRPGGWIIHCPGTAETASEEEQHTRLISERWGYSFSRYRETDGWKRKYWKEIPPAGKEGSPCS